MNVANGAREQAHNLIHTGEQCHNFGAFFLFQSSKFSVGFCMEVLNPCTDIWMCEWNHSYQWLSLLWYCNYEAVLVHLHKESQGIITTYLLFSLSQHWFVKAKGLSFKKIGWKVKGRTVHKRFLDPTVLLVTNILLYLFLFLLSNQSGFLLHPQSTFFCESYQIRNTFNYEKNLLQLIQKETITETPTYYIWSLFKKQTETMQDTGKHRQISLWSCLEMYCSWSHL